MANKPSFLKKLLEFQFFKNRFKFSRKKKAVSPEDAPAELPQHRPLKLSEHQRRSEPPTDPFELELPIDHPLQQLWRLRRDEAGWLPSPSLRLDAPGAAEPPFTAETAAGEHTGLKLSINNSAKARLNAAVPKVEDAPPINLNAQVTVYTARSGLSAWVLAYPPVGEGAELTSQDVSSALAGAKVTYGIDEALVKNLPEKDDRYFHLFLAAQGQAPNPGKNGEVEDLYPRVNKQSLPVDEYNRVDYTAVGKTQNIEKDAVICNILPPTNGVPGRNVLGKELPTTNGVPAAPPMGRNTKMNEDGSQLLAGRDGSLEFNGGTFQVNPVMDISGNVDYSTGSVNFLGDVHIQGDVCSGFTVRAMGSVKVDGVVESATIEAGGDLILAKGVQGNNQAVLRAHKDIYAKYLENCSVYARQDLYSEAIIGCNVYSNASVYAKNGRGAIIGGKIWAARLVEANAIGSKMEVRTTITIGGLPCEDFERALLLEEMAQLEKDLQETERQPNNPARTARISKLRMQLSVDKLKLRQYDKNLEAYQAQSQHQRPGQLIFDVAYAGTRIKMEEDLMRIRTETRHSTAMAIEGKIRLMT